MNEFMTIEEYLEAKGNPTDIRVVEQNNDKVVEIHSLTNSSFKHNAIVHDIDNSSGDAFLLYTEDVLTSYRALNELYQMDVSENVRDLTEEEIAKTETVYEQKPLVEPGEEYHEAVETIDSETEAVEEWVVSDTESVVE